MYGEYGTGGGRSSSATAPERSLHLLYFPTAKAVDTAAEHGRIATTITAGDPDAARTAMRDHLTAARQRHLPAFDDAFTSTGRPATSA